MKTKQQQRNQAAKVLKATTVPASKILYAITDPAWEIYREATAHANKIYSAELERINNLPDEDTIVVEGRTYKLVE